MCSSIREFGFKIPVLARSNGEEVDGHLRLKPARKLHITEVPVILCDEWSEAQVKAFEPTPHGVRASAVSHLLNGLEFLGALSP
jgi:ParB-like chromosome segregation protein Spo0J